MVTIGYWIFLLELLERKWRRVTVAWKVQLRNRSDQFQFDAETLGWSMEGHRIHSHRISSVRVVDLVDDCSDLRNRELRLDVETAERVRCSSDNCQKPAILLDDNSMSPAMSTVQFLFRNL